MNYRKQQAEHQIAILNNIIGGDSHPYFLDDGKTNLYKSIRKDVLIYFEKNEIGWWHGKEPTANTLSSQISCLNHLFSISDKKDIVLSMVKNLDESFIDVLPIPNEKDSLGMRYIGFEVVAQTPNYMNEGTIKRGATCTSLDALIIAKRIDGSKCLIPIEWKYTENDHSDKSSNETRHKRYDALISNSKFLKVNSDSLSLFFKEPYYQLMRQTLWAELIIREDSIFNDEKYKWYEASDYLHLHVIPSKNVAMRGENNKMEQEWKSCLKDPLKYRLIGPDELFQPIADGYPECKELIEYLSQRYWQ